MDMMMDEAQLGGQLKTVVDQGWQLVQDMNEKGVLPQHVHQDRPFEWSELSAQVDGHDDGSMKVQTSKLQTLKQ